MASIDKPLVRIKHVTTKKIIRASLSDKSNTGRSNSLDGRPNITLNQFLLNPIRPRKLAKNSMIRTGTKPPSPKVISRLTSQVNFNVPGKPA